MSVKLAFGSITLGHDDAREFVWKISHVQCCSATENGPWLHAGFSIALRVSVHQKNETAGTLWFEEVAKTHLHNHPVAEPEDPAISFSNEYFLVRMGLAVCVYKFSVDPVAKIEMVASGYRVRTDGCAGGVAINMFPACTHHPVSFLLIHIQPPSSAAANIRSLLEVVDMRAETRFVQTFFHAQYAGKELCITKTFSRRNRLVFVCIDTTESEHKEFVVALDTDVFNRDVALDMAVLNQDTAHVAAPGSSTRSDPTKIETRLVLACDAGAHPLSVCVSDDGRYLARLIGRSANNVSPAMVVHVHDLDSAAPTTPVSVLNIPVGATICTKLAEFTGKQALFSGIDAQKNTFVVETVVVPPGVSSWHMPSGDPCARIVSKPHATRLCHLFQGRVTAFMRKNGSLCEPAVEWVANKAVLPAE